MESWLGWLSRLNLTFPLGKLGFARFGSICVTMAPNFWNHAWSLNNEGRAGCPASWGWWAMRLNVIHILFTSDMRSSRSSRTTSFWHLNTLFIVFHPQLNHHVTLSCLTVRGQTNCDLRENATPQTGLLATTKNPKEISIYCRYILDIS